MIRTENAVLIFNNSTERELIPADGKKFTLKEISDIMECSKIIKLDSILECPILINAELLNKIDLPTNVRANLYAFNKNSRMVKGKAILICNPKLIEGIL